MQTTDPPSGEQLPGRVQDLRDARALKTRVTISTKFQSFDQARIDGGRSAQMTRLNFDIISIILEHFEPDQRFEDFANSLGIHYSGIDCSAYQWQPRQAQLLYLCTMSSQWLEPCRRLLYRGFYASNSDNIVKFASTLRKYPTLGRYVHYLFIDNWDIALFVTLMPNIQLLWLYAPHAGLPIFLNSSILSLKRLRHITFISGVGRFKIAWADEKTARTAWPLLETMVSRTHVLFPLCLAPGRAPFASLRTLDWMPGSATSLDDDPASIPSLCSNTLRKLRLANLRFPEDILLRLVQNHSNSLEELAIKQCYISSHEMPIVSALKSIKNLRKLEFYENKSNLPNPTKLPELPDTLVQIRIEWPQCTPEEALEFIRERSGNAGSLRSFDLGAWWGLQLGSTEECQRVKDVAHSCGVEFVLSLSGRLPSPDLWD